MTPDNEKMPFAPDQIKWDERGLVPAIVQDAASKEVLMLAYMNRESLAKSIESGETWFWSRSRGELWHKGETSGHLQRIRSLRYDCDADTLLVLVDQIGPACHTGAYSCFGGEIPLGAGTSAGASGEAGSTAAGNAGAVAAGQSAGTGLGAGQAANGNAAADDAVRDRFAMLSVLESVIARRDAERPEGSYTTYLFMKGLDKILKKVGEETAEVIIAAKNRDAEELRYEASDLIFHLLVLLREARLPLDDVMAELDRRHLRKAQG